jgi:hypothetical protein
LGYHDQWNDKLLLECNWLYIYNILRYHLSDYSGGGVGRLSI